MDERAETSARMEPICSRPALTGTQNIAFRIQGQLFSTKRASITLRVAAMPLPGGLDNITNVGVGAGTNEVL